MVLWPNSWPWAGLHWAIPLLVGMSLYPRQFQVYLLVLNIEKVNKNNKNYYFVSVALRWKLLRKDLWYQRVSGLKCTSVYFNGKQNFKLDEITGLPVVVSGS